MNSRKVKQIVGTILCFIALGFSVAAQANRYWVIIHRIVVTSIITTRTEHGLYEKCVSGACTSYGWSPNNTEEWGTFCTRLLLLISDLFIGVAFVAGIVAFRLYGKRRRRCLWITGGFNAFGGILMSFAGIVYITLMQASFLSTALLLATSSETLYVGFCYFFCWAAGILFIAGGILQSASAVYHEDEEEYENKVESYSPADAWNKEDTSKANPMKKVLHKIGVTKPSYIAASTDSAPRRSTQISYLRY